MQATPRVSALLLNEDSSLMSSLTCSICMETFVDPVTTKCCSEVYCKKCILEWMVSGSGDCPHCSVSEFEVNPEPVRTIINAIDSLEVCCPHAHQGCSYTFQYAQMSSHLSECSFERGRVDTYRCVRPPTSEYSAWADAYGRSTHRVACFHARSSCTTLLLGRYLRQSAVSCKLVRMLTLSGAVWILNGV